MQRSCADVYSAYKTDNAKYLIFEHLPRTEYLFLYLNKGSEYAKKAEDAFNFSISQKPLSPPRV
jgi:hypothetical protein